MHGRLTCNNIGLVLTGVFRGVCLDRSISLRVWPQLILDACLGAETNKSEDYTASSYSSFSLTK